MLYNVIQISPVSTFPGNSYKRGKMKDKQENVTIYSFMCPTPCNREIVVEAKNNLDAIDKIIMAGAISCRNGRIQHACEKSHLDLPPIPEEQLKKIVSLYIREECEA